MVRRRSEPGPLQSGLLHEGGGVLVGGCAYCTNPRTLWSTPDPLPVDPDPRAVRVVSGLIVGLRLWSSLPLAPAHPAHRSQPAHRHPGQASEVLLAGEHHAPVQASGGVYQRLIQTYGADCPGLGKYLMQQAVPDRLGRLRPRPAPGNPLIVRTTAHEFCGHFSVRY